ncbi:MAG: hypothetical protein DRI86_07455 [Bacteroidetes bacterium]|nr:MAG: hypothetical protein DRI86_07455 [Bacteroidota bacterium]
MNIELIKEYNKDNVIYNFNDNDYKIEISLKNEVIADERIKEYFNKNINDLIFNDILINLIKK